LGADRRLILSGRKKYVKEECPRSLKNWKRNVGILGRGEAPKFFDSSQPIIPVFHYSNIPVGAKPKSSYIINKLQKYFP
jgi:hypothetical protein